MQHHAATTMRFAASTRKLAPIYAQNNTRTPDDKSHAAIPMRSATGDSKTSYNYAHTSTPKAASSHRYTAAKKNDKPTPAAPVAHTRYLSSSPAATLHGKTQGFVLRLPPQNIAHATFTSSPFPFVTTSLRHHFPSSPLPFLTTSLRHHFPSSPLPFVTTSLPHHFPSSPLPFLSTSLHHHFPSSPLPFVTTSLRQHSLHQHFPSSPLPFVTTSLRHRPVIVTTLHQDQFHSFLVPPYVLLSLVLLCDLPPFIKVNSTASYSFVMCCYLMYCFVIYHPSSRSIPPLLILLLCIVMLCIVM